MKKLLALVMALSLALSIVGCTNSTAETSSVAGSSDKDTATTESAETSDVSTSSDIQASVDTETSVVGTSSVVSNKQESQTTGSNNTTSTQKPSNTSSNTASTQKPSQNIVFDFNTTDIALIKANSERKDGITTTRARYCISGKFNGMTGTYRYDIENNKFAGPTIFSFIPVVVKYRWETHHTSDGPVQELIIEQSEIDRAYSQINKFLAHIRTNFIISDIIISTSNTAPADIPDAPELIDELVINKAVYYVCLTDSQGVEYMMTLADYGEYYSFEAHFNIIEPA